MSPKSSASVVPPVSRAHKSIAIHSGYPPQHHHPFSGPEAMREAECLFGANVGARFTEKTPQRPHQEDKQSSGSPRFWRNFIVPRCTGKVGRRTFNHRPGSNPFIYHATVWFLILRGARHSSKLRLGSQAWTRPGFPGPMRSQIFRRFAVAVRAVSVGTEAAKLAEFESSFKLKHGWNAEGAIAENYKSMVPYYTRRNSSLGVGREWRTKTFC
jgi:hypothetical protein